MSFKLKTKKISIIAGAITIMISTFSSFATGPSSGVLPKQVIGMSSEGNSLIEQKIDDSTNLSSDLPDEEIITNSLPRTINLNTPGNYRLVGAASAGSLVSQDPNETVEIVNTDDRIVISGGGIYNVTLDNVNIIAKVNDLEETTPFSIMQNVNVNLTLKGNNILNNEISSNVGLYTGKTSTLTITGSSEKSSLRVGGLDDGINGEGTIMIKSGIITTRGKHSGIKVGEKLIIEGGNITSSGNHGITGTHITIKSGTVEARGKNFGISGPRLMINGGNITSSGDFGICSSNIRIEGGNIKVNGNIEGITCTLIGIRNGTIEAVGRDYGICIEAIGCPLITGGNITSSGKIEGIRKFDQMPMKGLNIKKNGHYIVYDINNKVTIEIKTTE